MRKPFCVLFLGLLVASLVGCRERHGLSGFPGDGYWENGSFRQNEGADVGAPARWKKGLFRENLTSGDVIFDDQDTVVVPCVNGGGVGDM
jgi:hypothetical protein